ncbi:MAG: type II secretion system protein [Burkholderiales bacterium]|nr:type II secretion system protein [Burkholderiales bacterium]
MTQLAHRRARGFTLVELMIVVAILGVLALGAVPLGELTAQRSRERTLKDNLREIRTAIDAYKRAADEGRIARKADESGYPPSLTALVEGTADAKAPDRRMHYFLRRLPRDPFADPTLRPEDTWGKRSYASPPSRPAEGSDVFDVYSRSPGTGLNGIPYRQW